MYTQYFCEKIFINLEDVSEGDAIYIHQQCGMFQNMVWHIGVLHMMDTSMLLFFLGVHMVWNPNLIIWDAVKLHPLQIGFGSHLWLGSLGIFCMKCLPRSQDYLCYTCLFFGEYKLTLQCLYQEGTQLCIPCIHHVITFVSHICCSECKHSGVSCLEYGRTPFSTISCSFSNSCEMPCTDLKDLHQTYAMYIA